MSSGDDRTLMLKIVTKLGLLYPLGNSSAKQVGFVVVLQFDKKPYI